MDCRAYGEWSRAGRSSTAAHSKGTVLMQTAAMGMERGANFWKKFGANFEEIH